MANKLIKDLTAASSVADTDLILVGDPTTGALKKATKTQIAGNTAQTLTDGASIAWNIANGNLAKVTLGGNRTLTISNMPSNSFAQLFVTQDNTGNRTLTLTGGVIPSAGLSLSTAGGSRDILTVFYDGTDYYWSIEKYGPAVVAPTLVDITYNVTTNVTGAALRWTATQNSGNAVSNNQRLGLSADGYIQFKWVGTEPSGQYSIFALDETAGNSNFTSLAYGCHTLNGNLGIISSGSLVSCNGTGRTMVANDLVRIKRASGTITVEWSSNGGTSWTVAHTFASTDNALLYPNIWFNVSGGFIDSPKGYNLS